MTAPNTYRLQMDLRGPFSEHIKHTRHMHKRVHRTWASVPRQGDLVVLDDTTGWARSVGAVAFGPGPNVTLHFFDCTEEDLHALVMAGFQPGIGDTGPGDS